MDHRALIVYSPSDFPISDFRNLNWERSQNVEIKNYWSGDLAPEGRHFAADLLWSDTALYVGFAANRREPLIVSDTPDLMRKTLGLWDRDVCEIFVAPIASEANRYFEFEIAPTGEWIDLAIELTSEKRITAWDYASNMQSAAIIETHQMLMALKIPFDAFGGPPDIGSIWRGNLCRCVGSGPERGYLSWQATNTLLPSFHVPSRFGEFEFVK